MKYLGDFAEDAVVYFGFSTNDGSGGRASFSASLEEADIVIFKDGTAMTLDASTITISSEPGSRTGVHIISIDMSNDADFTTGSDYIAVLYPSDETIDSQSVAGVLAQWSCENRSVNVARIGGQDVALSSDNRLRVDVAEWNDIPLATTNPFSTVATAAKLLAYVQLLARSDAAIATDNATELAAINADGGSGAGNYDNSSDSVEALRDRGDAAWTTGAGGGLDAAGVRAAIGLASANLDTQLADLPTVSEFEARTLAAADYFDPATDAVANVTLVDTCTTNTDMRGTDSAMLATENGSSFNSIPDMASQTLLVAVAGYVDTEIAAIKAVTDNIPDSGAMTSIATASALTTVDTVVDAIKAVTDNIPDSGAMTSIATAEALATVDSVADAIKVVTDQMVFTTANQLDVQVLSAAANSITAAALNADAITEIQNGLATADALTAVDSVVDAIKVVTDQMVFTTANQLDVQVLSAAANSITAAALNADAVTEIQNGLATADALTIVDANIDSIVAALANPAGFKKNTAVSNFTFYLADSSDHVSPATGKTVTAQRSLDGAALGSCSNSVAEISNGLYKINLSASDMNADVITLRFTATGADDRLITIVTEP